MNTKRNQSSRILLWLFSLCLLMLIPGCNLFQKDTDGNSQKQSHLTERGSLNKNQSLEIIISWMQLMQQFRPPYAQAGNAMFQFPYQYPLMYPTMTLRTSNSQSQESSSESQTTEQQIWKAAKKIPIPILVMGFLAVVSGIGWAVYSPGVGRKLGVIVAGCGAALIGVILAFHYNPDLAIWIFAAIILVVIIIVVFVYRGEDNQSSTSKTINLN